MRANAMPPTRYAVLPDRFERERPISVHATLADAYRALWAARFEAHPVACIRVGRETAPGVWRWI